MKSIKIFAAAGAIALLGMAGLSSCKQNNTPEGPGNYNGETVKTEFAIFIPDAGKADKVLRMPGANVPKPGRFLGMDNIKVYPFTTTVNSGATSSVAVQGTDTRLGNTYISINSIDADGLGANNTYAQEVSIPLGTNHFLFYAHGTGDNTTVENKFKHGVLQMTGEGSATPSGITFSLSKIDDGSSNTKGAALVTYLNLIANDSHWANTSTGETNVSDAEKWLGDVRDSLLLLQAGSSSSVQEMIQRLYKTLLTRSDNANVAGIITAITNNTYVSNTKAADNTTDSLTFTDAISGYPANRNLPDGAAAVAWNTSASPKAFELASSNSWKSSNGTGTINTADFSKYVYPACIYYFANSGLKTSTSKQSTYYNSKSSWNQILTDLYNENSGKNIYVANNTKSVAISDSIDYGVALLQTKVKSSSATLSDYNSTNTSIDAAKITMTGLLIGCQGKVGFNFEPLTATGDSIIYDKYLSEVDGKNYNLSSSDFTHADSTIVLETEANRNVLIAVEFYNGAQDFLGVNGRLIPKGTHFYMVAELDASKADENSGTKVTDMDGKVFKQDYTTTAQLTVGNLSKAYNVVPDLRISNLELGFSVDLKWESGHTFNITL